MSPDSEKLHDYLLGELPAAEREAMAARLRTDATLQEEARELESTLLALRSVPDEEPPRRIAFIADQPAAPRWYERWLASAPRLAFASAAMMSVAMLGHGWLVRTAPVQPVSTLQAVQGLSEEDVDLRIAKAVNSARRDWEQSAGEKLRAESALQVKSEVERVEKRLDSEYRFQLASLEENARIMQKQFNRIYVQTAGLSVDAGAER
jgi:anti-sigma-K factor RskA